MLRATGLLLLWALPIACSSGEPDGTADDTDGTGSGTDSSVDAGTEPPLTHAEPVMVVDNTAWVLTAPDADPFHATSMARSEGAVACTDENLKIDEQPDGPWFEIKTNVCGYVTVTQKTLAEIPERAWLTLRIWHFEITKGPGPYRLAISLGDPAAIVWEREFELPSEPGGTLGSELIYKQWQATGTWPAGTPVYWNLSNHGSNSWNMIELSVGGKPLETNP